VTAFFNNCTTRITHPKIITGGLWVAFPKGSSFIYNGINTYMPEDNMKIELEGTLLKMTPENEREKTELNQLWTILIDCVKENKKMVPVGQYIPGMKEVAVFNIE
jgi:hypothetical protein